jgi:hypothetical protein
MTLKKFVVMLSFLSFATACTSDADKAQDAALESAKEQFQTELREELGKAITGHDKVQFTTVDQITKRTEFTVLKKEVKDSQADFEIQAKTIPVKVKNSLIEIISRLDSKVEGRFNVSDALKLISQQLGLGPEESSVQVYKLKLKKEGDWKKVEAKN